jgi:hypothetical protein
MQDYNLVALHSVSITDTTKYVSYCIPSSLSLLFIVQYTTPSCKYDLLPTNSLINKYLELLKGYYII